MINRKTSAYLSLCICIASAVLFTVLLFTFKPLFTSLVTRGDEVTESVEKLVNTVSIGFYCTCPVIAAALYMLIRLLLNIIKDKVFVMINVQYIRFVSYCCYFVMIITGVFTAFYVSFCFVAYIMAVVGTLLRVVKNIMQSAVEIKSENDLTI